MTIVEEQTYAVGREELWRVLHDAHDTPGQDAVPVQLLALASRQRAHIYHSTRTSQRQVGQRELRCTYTPRVPRKCLGVALREQMLEAVRDPPHDPRLRLVDRRVTARRAAH